MGLIRRLKGFLRPKSLSQPSEQSARAAASAGPPSTGPAVVPPRTATAPVLASAQKAVPPTVTPRAVLRQPSSKNFTPYALYVFEIADMQANMKEGQGYSTYSWAHYARDIIATHLGTLAPGILRTDFCASLGEIMSPRNAGILVKSDKLNPNLDLLSDGAKEKFVTGQGLFETFYLVGIGGVLHETTLAAHRTISGVAPAGYRGVILFDLPAVRIVAEIATGLGLYAGPLR
jgi:hypothetical protein